MASLLNKGFGTAAAIATATSLTVAQDLSAALIVTSTGQFAEINNTVVFVETYAKFDNVNFAPTIGSDTSHYGGTISDLNDALLDATITLTFHYDDSIGGGIETYILYPERASFGFGTDPDFNYISIGFSGATNNSFGFTGGEVGVVGFDGDESSPPFFNTQDVLSNPKWDQRIAFLRGGEDGIGTYSYTLDSFNIQNTIPEPSVALLAATAAGAAALRRRRPTVEQENNAPTLG